MLITRVSMFSGKSRTMDLPISPDQMARYEAGALIQDAFPNLSPAQREFILTGATDEEWGEAFPEDDDDFDLADEAAF